LRASFIGVRPNSPPPDDQRVVEQPKLFEIRQERVHWPVGLAAEMRQFLDDLMSSAP